MKHVGMGMAIVMAFAFTLLIVTTVDAKTVRRVEMERALNTSMRSCMKTLMTTDTYEPEPGSSDTKKDLFIADFMRLMLVQINTKSNVIINIKDIDVEKGLLSAEIIEEFYYPVGVPGRLAKEKTMIYDRKEMPVQHNYTIAFHVKEADTDIIYKKFDLKENTKIIVPAAPQAPEGMRFKGWSLTENGAIENLTNATCTNDTDYYAVFEP